MTTALPSHDDRKGDKPQERLASDKPMQKPSSDKPTEVKLADPPKTTRQEPSRWERLKAWCRDAFECQTEEDIKQQHDEALQKYKDEHKSEGAKDTKTSQAPSRPAWRQNLDGGAGGRVEETASAGASQTGERATVFHSSEKLGERNGLEARSMGGTATGHLAELRSHSFSETTRVGFPSGMKGGLGETPRHGFGGMGLVGLGGLRVGGFGGI